MARKVDLFAPYRMSTHKLGKYVYVCTQPATVDETSGKRTYSRIHWGRFDPQKKTFTPNLAFLLLTPEERKKYIFPEDWNLTAIETMAGMRGPGRQPQTRHGDRLYGDVWLLEQIAEKTGLRKDLLTVFDGNKEVVDMVLTLAMFPYISRYSYNRLPRWQRIVRTPCEEPLTASRITRLTQRITTLHRDDLFRLRAKRLGTNALCAVDSTSRSAYGRSLADVRWGKNKDRPDLPQTNEIVVYSLTDHQPIYYRTFPGNMPDCRTFEIIVKALDDAGYKSLQLITDRGYETIKNLERSILDERCLITAAPTSRRMISAHIRRYGDFVTKPATMTHFLSMRSQRNPAIRPNGRPTRAGPVTPRFISHSGASANAWYRLDTIGFTTRSPIVHIDERNSAASNRNSFPFDRFSALVMVCILSLLSSGPLPGFRLWRGYGGRPRPAPLVSHGSLRFWVIGARDGLSFGP